MMRREVMVFGESMEINLQANDHKGGWDNCDFKFLFEKLNEEYKEVLVAYEEGDLHNLRYELSDLANICMMIYDKAGKQIKNDWKREKIFYFDCRR